MTILILSATGAEISPSISPVQAAELKPGMIIKSHHSTAEKMILFLIGGVGMVNTTYYLTKAIRELNPDVCINAGIAGAFNRKIELGEVVKVKDDCFADLGAEDGEDFLGAEEMKLTAQNILSSDLNLFSNECVQNIRCADAITVNTVHGNEKTIERTYKKFPADIESMEGAAFMQVCQLEKIKHLQLRSISNYVERRNRESWNIALAVKNLNQELNRIIAEL